MCVCVCVRHTPHACRRTAVGVAACHVCWRPCVCVCVCAHWPTSGRASLAALTVEKAALAQLPANCRHTTLWPPQPLRASRPQQHRPFLCLGAHREYVCTSRPAACSPQRRLSPPPPCHTGHRSGPQLAQAQHTTVAHLSLMYSAAIGRPIIIGCSGGLVDVDEWPPIVAPEQHT